MDSILLSALAKYGILTGLAIFAASLLITRLFGARTDATEENARSTLIDGLSKRISALETAQSDHMKQFDAERQRRLDAEAKVAELTARVAVLESQLRTLGHDPR